MGFTGKEAHRWKKKFILAFNKMEAELKNRVLLEAQKTIAEQAALLAKKDARIRSLTKQPKSARICFIHKETDLVHHVLAPVENYTDNQLAIQRKAASQHQAKAMQHNTLEWALKYLPGGDLSSYLPVVSIPLDEDGLMVREPEEYELLMDKDPELPEEAKARRTYVQATT